MNSAIVCEDLHFTYESATEPVLNGVNLELAAGAFAVIAGPSGAGKSTFCRTLNNVIPSFYRGKINGRRLICGELLDSQPIAELARKVGMVFQDFEQQLFSTNTTLELAFSMENFGTSPAEMRERLEPLLTSFGLKHLTGREPASLSGGEKQKLAIASALAYRPPILVLDEPTTDLDLESKEFVLQFLPALRDWIETLLIVDIETENFMKVDRMFLFNQGTIAAAGTGNEILTNSSLLERNSLRPLELVQLQQKLGQTPVLLKPAEFATVLRDSYTLEGIHSKPRENTEEVFEINHLSHRYPGQQADALHDVTFEIRKGEFVGIIGSNGSGKSTLLRHLNGLQLPEKGSVQILGKEVRQWDRHALARRVGLVFQNPDHQIFNTTVREEVEFGPRRFGLPENEIQENSGRAIETMDLMQQTERDPFQLSKGERQRVAVASVLSLSPEILILDEPTTGLDYRQQKYLMDLLKDLNDRGATVVIVTHALKLVAEYCNFCVLLADGKLEKEGNPREVLFGTSRLKLPPLLELSREMKGNAVTVEELIRNLKAR
jgi:energy-coupling factor transport system ATP-binding protein